MLEEKKNDIHRLMSGDVELICDANCVLARLWRLTLFQLNIKAPMWEGLLENYIHECKSHIGVKKAGNLKGNLPKGLSGDEVTWQRFCEGLSVFNFEEVRLTVSIRDKEATKDLTVYLPRILGNEKPGEVLRILWDMVNKEFPEKCARGAWTKLMDTYIKRCKDKDGSVPSYARGNLKRALSGDALMFSMFYRGLAIYDFDGLSFKLECKPRRKTSYEVIRLTVTK